VALAGQVIASHYAEPLALTLAKASPLLAQASDGAEVLAQLPPGAELRVLDRSRGWAWGYAAGKVGYVRASVL
jgi:hypothetical protein